MLTNVFNRLARRCFYEAQKNFEGFMPLGAPAADVVARCHKAMAEYEAIMHTAELHSIMTLMDDFIRWAQKHWADGIKAAEGADDADMRRQILVDSFFTLRVATLLMHPVAPDGCERIVEHLGLPAERVFSWNAPFEDMAELCDAADVEAGRHAIVELPPRTDFFAKHESQFK